MSPRVQKVVVGLVAVVAVCAMAWALRGSFQGGAASPEQDLQFTVLCQNCGYLGRARYSQLRANGEAAKSPVFGRGYICPKCQKETLYLNPNICPQCKTAFLPTRAADGAIVIKCPKCGGKG